MADVREYTDPFISMYRQVPAIKDGVCNPCHGAPGQGYARCYSCHLTINQVTYPASLVVPISLYKTSTQLHHVLWNYKNGPPDNARQRHRLQVASTIGRFLVRHRACIAAAAGSDWTVITTVPSSQSRAGTHPLEETTQMVVQLKPQYRRLLQAGPEALGHRRASDTGYATVEDVAGMSVLLIDDTLTTGARIHSAASALQLVGASVVAAVVVGRVITPEFNDENRELWDEAGQQPFDFDVCCLE